MNGFSIAFPAGFAPAGYGERVVIRIDGKESRRVGVDTDRSMEAHFFRTDRGWVAEDPSESGIRKRHDLQGPIDDAFMDAFVIVKPTGTSKQPKFQSWVEAESSRAIEQWRRQFRGEARVIDDTALTPEIIANANLVLWGDPSSNAVLAKIADKLPITWAGDAIKVDGKSYSSNDHALILICPNPLNPKRYVVLNSGFTFREYDYLNNARQVPKLPDWAVIDLNTPPDSRRPGNVIAADFFGEDWKLKPSH